MKRFAGLASAVALAFLASACAETDAGVTTKVKAQLAADDMVKAYKVDVDTREHVVTLRGEVETPAVKEQAIRIARSTEGVRDVVDELRVVGTSGTIEPSLTIERTEDRLDRAEDKVEIKIEDDTDGLRDNIKDGARATGSAVKKGAEATADGAKKVGGAIRDGVTDDDKDSDNDGK